MEAPFATTMDLASVWRGYDESDAARATNLLTMASRAIAALCDAPSVDPDVLRLVTCKVVARMMQAGTGGDGVKQEQWTVGSYSSSTSYENPAGDFYLTQQERQLLGIGEVEAAYVGPNIP